MKKLYILLFLLIVSQINCKKLSIQPKIESNTVISGFFKFSGVKKGEKIPSFRLNINSKSDNTFTLNILTPFNSLVSSMYFDGKKFVFLDLKNKVAYIQLKRPFNLERIANVKVDLISLMEFFNKRYVKNNKIEYSNNYESGKILTNKLGQIVIIGNDGFRAVLEPVGKLKALDDFNLKFSIPENFKVIYVD